MFDFLIVLGVVILSISVIMEAVKGGIEWIGNKIVSKKHKEERKVDIPPFVWRIIASLFSAGGVVLARVIFVSVEKVEGLTAVMTNWWMMLLWFPIVWWAQLQVDMKVIKEHIVPMLKKSLENKLGAK